METFRNIILKMNNNGTSNNIIFAIKYGKKGT